MFFVLPSSFALFFYHRGDEKHYLNLVLYQIPRIFSKHPLAKAGPCRDDEAEEKGGSHMFEVGCIRCFGSILTVSHST